MLVSGNCAEVGVGLQDGLNDVSFDEFSFSPGAAAKGVMSDAVDVSKGSGRGLVKDDNGVGGEELFVDASGGKVGSDVFGGIVGDSGSMLRR